MNTETVTESEGQLASRPLIAQSKPFFLDRVGDYYFLHILPLNSLTKLMAKSPLAHATIFNIVACTILVNTTVLNSQNI